MSGVRASCGVLALIGLCAWASVVQAAKTARTAHARAAELVDPTAVAELEGVWLFHAGDNAAFSQPSLDDSSWEQREVPTSAMPWSLRWRGYGWYRLHVAVGERAVGYDWMLSLGRAREAAEIYVNGALVAQRGHFGSRLEGGDRSSPLSALLPAPVLRPGDNVIAARLYDPTYSGGLVAGPILLGPPALVRERLERCEGIGSAWQLALAALAVIIALAHLVMARGRWAGREAGWLSGAAIGLALAQLGNAGILTRHMPVLELGLRLPLVGAAGAVLCFAGFFATRYEDTRAAHVRWGGVALLVIVAALLLVPEAVVYWAGSPVVLVSAVVAALYAAYLLAQAARRQEPHAMLIFASVVGLALLLVYGGLTASDSGLLPPASLAGAIGVLLIASLSGVREMLAEHDLALAQVQMLEQLLEAAERPGILEATAMSITDNARFLEAVVHEAARELSARRCSLVLARDHDLIIAAGIGLPRHTLGTLVPMEGSVAGWVFAHGRSVTEKTIPEDLAELPRAGHYATRAFISEPIKIGERCLGVLNVSDRLDGGDFTTADASAVSQVAAKLALVITSLGPH